MNAVPKTNPEDWHPADIKAALTKKGWSFAQIARKYGYAPSGPNMVMWKPWPVVEQIVADIVGVHPSDIWPSRYDKRRRPLKGDLRSFERLRTQTENIKPGRG